MNGGNCMALSNWDLLAFNTQGEPCEGIFTHGNTSVRIYKNWAYVDNKTMWQEGGSYIKPVIAEVYQGDLTIHNVNILAKRHADQSSIFIICTAGYSDEKEIMVGIGCCGYLNDTKIYTEKLKLDLENYTWYSCLGRKDGKSYVGVSGFPNNPDTHSMLEIEVPAEMVIPDEEMYIGVSETTYKAFLEFLDREAENATIPKEYVDKIKASTAIRFNQGDRYFADNLGNDGIPATEVGKTSEPVMNQLLNKK
jgi:hypothetical protein